MKCKESLGKNLYSKIEDPMIRAPFEEDIDALIASTTSKRMAAFLKCIKETYADPGEILLLNGST